MASIPWSYAPYRPFMFESGDIYVTRIVPSANAVHLEWLGSGTFTVYAKKRGEEDFSLQQTVTGNECIFTGLETETDYEFQVTQGEEKSRIRLARTGEAPGVVVNYLHPEDEAYSFSGRFLCSPSIVRHPDGYLLASMDLFGVGTPQNLTLIFRSDDDGETWHYVSELMPCFWGKLFVHKEKLYMISVSTEYGDLLIGRSDDGGKTFSAPTVLLRGSCSGGYPGCHKTPEQPLVDKGRLYITMEWGSWAAGFHAPMIISCDENADLLDADSWAISPPLPYDPTWPGTANGPSNASIEGVLAVAPNGKLYNLMRYEFRKAEPSYGLAIAYEVDTDHPGVPLQYARTFPLPGNLSKFDIVWDEKTGLYYMLLSRITDPEHISMRNLLSLMRSRDLWNWELVTDVLDRRDLPVEKCGFQYIDSFIDGDDILFLCRTAINGADTFHNSNYSTFHRIKNFRAL